MLKLSLTSHALDLLGRTLIASTAKLKMPADFYHVPGDRRLPSSAEYAKANTRPQRIAVDAFRRRLMLGVAIGGSSVAACACLVLALMAQAVLRLAH